MLSPKTFPCAGERVTQRLTVEEQQVLAKCFATGLSLLLKIRPETLRGKLNFPQNLKNFSDVGRDQVIHLKLVCATQPLNEMY